MNFFKKGRLLFVSYCFTKHNGEQGFGSTVIETSLRLKNAEEIIAVTDIVLHDRPALKHIVILNWKFL